MDSPFTLASLILLILVVIIVLYYILIKNLIRKFEEVPKLVKDFPNVILQKYKILEVLGNGAFGTVYRAQSRVSGNIVAIKIINQSWCKSIEANLMMRLDNDHIVKAFDQVQTPFKNFIVMEYMPGGSLQNRLERKGKLNDTHTKLYFYQMCAAVQYLHEKGATHRDLKPDNMLLSCEKDETLLKITDFGLSHCCFGNMSDIVGDMRFMAPEVLSGKYGQSADIWSLGLVLLCCLSGNFPKLGNVLSFINNFNRNSVCHDLKKLIDCMLQEEPARRSNIKDVLASSWLNDNEIVQTVACLRTKLN